ncbi:MAG: hypothetical protein IKJ16_06500 [Agathobacter sp.]|nr:hypothetical protein [Agathobacter sp.]
MKAFMGVFMVLFLMATSTAVMGAFYQVLHAQDTHALMIDELENSDYAKNVMNACFEIAEQENYRLQLSLYSNTEEGIICTSSADIPESVANIMMVEVVLFYDIEIAFFEIATEQQLFGYAR